TQVVLPRLKTDLLEILEAVIDGRLDQIRIEWDDGAAACVVAASGGYPGKYRTGIEITGLEQAGAMEGVTIFHAGTKHEDGRLVTSGGRVLGVTAVAGTLGEALERAYRAADQIHFDGIFYRHDIGRAE
ncbi:MAG: phosphoribosylglycinamide synthetase C domain-containing protein, partial [Clostridia bacterium]|nr:phosphoribosylglycinamide synthetase C domain-containing protein [Clostridia bacterium]